MSTDTTPRVGSIVRLRERITTASGGVFETTDRFVVGRVYVILPHYGRRLSLEKDGRVVIPTIRPELVEEVDE